jgi:hypothetical protein
MPASRGGIEQLQLWWLKPVARPKKTHPPLFPCGFTSPLFVDRFKPRLQHREAMTNICSTQGKKMSEKINIALLGLGSVGQEFAENFLEIIQEGGKPVEIVAVAHRHLDSPVALGFQQSGVTVFKDAVEVVKMGDAVDIIFDLTGDPATRLALRKALQESNNQHTVIAPEIMAKLLSMFFDGEVDLSQGKGGGY